MKVSLKEFFSPSLITSLKNYTRKDFVSDLMAGIIVGIVALPLAIAFGIASGVSPEKGIITAIIGGFLVSALGGSKVQVGGPTGAFIVIVYGIIAQYGLDGLAIATVMAGILLVLLGVLRLGSVIKFIPYPIIIGFTGGIAVTIFTTQIKDFFGMQIAELPGDFLGKWSVYLSHLHTINWAVTAVSVLTVCLIALIPKISRKLPGSMVAIVLMSVAVLILQRMGIGTEIDTIGSRFTFEAAWPQAVSLNITREKVQGLVMPAFTIAMLGAIESLLSASVADGVINDRHHSNTELIAQGAANIVVPFFGGIPVTGAIARTMTNIDNGGRTPVAGIIHSVVLLLILLFFGKLVGYIPMATLAGILVVVSYNMSGWRSFVAIFRGPKEDILVLVTTFLLTVIFDLTIAIEIGVLLAMLLFTRRVYKSTQIVHHDGARIEIDNEVHASSQGEHLDIPAGVEVFEIQGPFFFGVANQFDEVTQRVGKNRRCESCV